MSILRDGGVSVFLVVLLLAAVGVGAARYLGKDDGRIEESVEMLMEDKIEGFLGLDGDSLHGLIDLTPRSPEEPIIIKIF